MMGDTARVAKYAKLRARNRRGVQPRTVGGRTKGLYRDGKPFQTSVKPGQWLPADKDIETFSPHVNLLAVLYDLAPKAQQAAIVEKVLGRKAAEHAALVHALGLSRRSTMPGCSTDTARRRCGAGGSCPRRSRSTRCGTAAT